MTTGRATSATTYRAPSPRSSISPATRRGARCATCRAEATTDPVARLCPSRSGIALDSYQPTDTLHDPQGDARRRLDARREREAGQGPEIRALLLRAESHLDELRGTAEVLAGVLPTRVE